MRNNINKKDIAIVGMSCKFPKSENIHSFWKNLKEGKELTHFYTDEELLKLGVDRDLINNPNFVKIKSTIDDPGSFDFSFFGYTRDEANVMDPQTRLLHQQVWGALEDANCKVFSYKGKIGLYLSASENFNWITHTLINPNNNVDPFYTSHLSNCQHISTIISYNLNLRGPSYKIDTACSSSLASIHIACRNLLLRECNLAVAGGVRIDCDQDKGYFYQEGMIASKDGRCKSFDKDSSGTIGGDGGAVVVLKRLEEAINDRDHIYAVVRSSATNNDGNRKVGYTAPSIIGQSDCIKLAHKIANVDPKTISYIEAHGTGTKLGDPVEVEALNKAFNYETKFECAIGSVKSNMGHLDAAAGVAGFVKTSLALQNKMIPPSIHYNQPNPGINFDLGPFYVNSTLKLWEKENTQPLRAGVSSLGIGGTNVHVVLEESPVVEKGNNSRQYQIIPYSAKTESSLKAYRYKLTEFLNKREDDLADLAYTLKIGREDFRYRDVLVGKDENEILNQLKEITKKDSKKTPISNKRNTIFMFPGQGSQYFEMAKDLYFEEPYFKSIMDEGFSILNEITGEDYANIIGYKNETKNSDKINNTLYTQPLLFLIEYSLASILLKWGVTPKYLIGHSLGEYVAACVSKVFSFKDALNIIVKRANLMQSVEEGTMIGVGAHKNKVDELLIKDLSIAAVNTDDSCVVSGNKDSIQEFVKILEENDVSHKILKTSHAFHSEMMEKILNKYEDELAKIQFSRPIYAIVSNLTGKEILEEEVTSPKYWVRHLRETVNFYDGLNFLFDKGNSVFVEIGAGNTLSKFCRQNKKFSASSNTIVNLVRHSKVSENDNLFLTKAIGELWGYGLNIDWDAYYEEEVRNKISIPSYCFDKFEFDCNVNPLSQLQNYEITTSHIKRKLSKWFYVPNWKKSIISPVRNNINATKNYVIFSEENMFITSVIENLKQKNNNIIEVRKGENFLKNNENVYFINPYKEDDFKQLFSEIKNLKIDFDQIIFNWAFKGETQEKITQALLPQFYLCKQLAHSTDDDKKKITFITHKNNTILGDEQVDIPMVTTGVIANICAQENSNISTFHVDVDQSFHNDDLITKIVQDLEHNTTELEVAFRNNNRWVKFYEEVNLEGKVEQNYVKPNKICVITGGLGEVGKVLTSHLCETYNSKVIVLGRSDIPSEDLWKEYLTAENVEPEIVSKIKEIQSLRAKGKNIFYYKTDVSDYNVLLETIKLIEEDHGVISGIIHAAGNSNNETFRLLENLNEEVFQKQFDPKIKGTYNLYNILKDRTIDFVWITSSLSTILGGLTYGAYAVANAYIDNFINHKQKELKNWFCVNLDGIDDDGINKEELIKVFEKSFSVEDTPQLIVSTRDITIPMDQKIPVNNLDKNESSTNVIHRPELDENYEPPSSTIENELCELWASFFGYEKIGIQDDFFELGGDSLKAMTLIKRIHKMYNVEINLKEFFSKANVKELSGEIDVALRLMKIQDQTKGVNVIKI
ncbi:beta-ketoacyl synthase N-terminal-like domain-containing protein [Aquimarina sp. M1]